ncbi:SMI1/KNR4 family protein [Priestia megaterium]|uniref:SMI1/KNR4 family protein n=1 Tax=Priestia megaterium TaxID=1404 RepID=UPI0021D67B6E|nr:SMI1/KNR4 family protein [Priestia megaterium]MCU7741519.1 SMI1/KNR4 family protein [Priestia megaterium]
MKFWKEIAEDTYKLKSLTEQDIKQAEFFFNVSLPKEYLNLLALQNGGEINYNSHPSPIATSWAETHINISFIMGIGKENGILETPYYLKEWGIPEGFILFSGEGHAWLAFDYRHSKSNPPIVYIDNEMNQIIKIADSFGLFLSKLYIEDTFSNEEELNDNLEWHYTKTDLERLMLTNDIDQLKSALSYITQEIVDFSEDPMDIKWLAEKFLDLSSHSNENVRIEVANLVWNFFMDVCESEILKQLMSKFEHDSDSDVRAYVEDIKEKLLEKDPL